MPTAPQDRLNHSPPIAGKSWTIEQLPGLSDREISQLKAANINTTGQLLQQTRTVQQQRSLAERLNVNQRSVRKWCVLADLARIPAVGCDYCGLLLHIGISSMTQLSETPPQLLHQKLLRLQVQILKRRDLCPSASSVQQWVMQARLLDSRESNNR
ncbi:MAG: DUF4332 domain-containing protein [Cyanobacteria bacterium P01_H01_bin.121]